MRIIIIIILSTIGLQAQDVEPQPMKFRIDGVHNTELTPIEQDFFLTGFEYSGEINFDTTLMNNSRAIQPHSPAVILPLGNGVENKFVSNT